MYVRIVLLILLQCLCSCYGGSAPNPSVIDKPGDGGKTDDSRPRKPAADKESSVMADSAVMHLIKKQNDKFPSILNELKTKRKKEDHWIWWVFPTEQPGKSEENPKTYVTVSQVDYVLTHADMDAWSAILEEIFDLLKSNPKGPWKDFHNKPNDAIIDSADHGRIGFALNFWLDDAGAKTKSNKRFYSAMKNLDKFDWPNRNTK